MRNLRIWAVAVLTLTLGFSANGFAVSNAANNDMVIKAATPVELETDVNNLVFTGTVKKIPNGTALITKKATYLLSGGNFDSIVGKEVNIIGKVVQEGSIEKIEVARAQLAQQ